LDVLSFTQNSLRLESFVMSALDVKTLKYEEKEIFSPDLDTLRSGLCAASESGS
jgi:hypothetical protein